MRSRIDPLIAERAPWLFKPGTGPRAARLLAEKALGYADALAMGHKVKDLPTPQVMRTLSDRIAQKVKAIGLHSIPRHGSALLVANHPTGIADGIVLHHILADIRPDLFIYANSDVLRVLPQMRSLIVPVEWRKDRRSHAKTRETMKLTEEAIGDGRIGVIFPSGRLAKRRGLRLYERDWMPSAAMIARKFDLPVIPIHIEARNSALFYLLDKIHPTLRDITLFHETLNKDRQPFVIKVGEPMSAKSLPAKSVDAIEVLRQETLGLGVAGDPTVSLIRTSPLLAG